MEPSFLLAVGPGFAFTSLCGIELWHANSKVQHFYMLDRRDTFVLPVYCLGMSESLKKKT